MLSDTATIDEAVAKLGYSPELRIQDVLDAYKYVQDGDYFLTRDARMVVVWALPAIPGDALSEDTKTGIADSLAGIIDHFPEGSTGQYIRFSHRDVTDRLDRFRAGVRNEGFFPQVGESILRVQERAARFGFFAHPLDADASMRQFERMRESGDDGSVIQAPRELSPQGISRGRYALVTEHYLIFSVDTSRTDKRGLSSVVEQIRSAVVLNKGEDALKRMLEDERRFKNILEEIEYAMTAAGLTVQRLDGNAVTQLLYRMLNPRRSVLSGAPENSGYETLTDALTLGDFRPGVAQCSVGTMIATSREGWAIDGYQHYVTSVRVMPEETRPAMLLRSLRETEGEGWCTINWSVPKQATYRRNLTMKHVLLSNQKDMQHIPLLASDPIKLAKREQDLDYVRNAINQEETVYHKVVRASVHFVCRGQDAVAALKRAKQLEKLLWNAGYRETLRGEAVIHHSLPMNFRAGAQQFIRRDFPILTTNLADLIPVYSGFPGLDDGRLMFNNSNGEPVPFDVFTKHATAGHALISGGTGTGKSFLINGVVSQSRAQAPTKTFVIDKGFNFSEHCEAAGGQTIVLVSEQTGDYTPICLNPFWIDESGSGAGGSGFREPSSSEYGYMLGILIGMLKAGTANEQGVTEPVTKEEMNRLMAHLQAIFSARQAGQELTLSDLTRSLEHNLDDTLAQSLARRLHDFTRGGIWGAIFDGPLEVNWDAEMIVLETSFLADAPCMDVVMLALFSQIEAYMKFRLPRSYRKLIVIDESWKVLAKQHLARTVAGFFREARKYQAAILLISQTLSDFRSLVNAEGGRDDGILANTRHFFMLGKSKQDMDDAEEMFGITQEERVMWDGVKSALPQFSEFFYLLRHKSNINYTALMRYCSDPVTYWMSSTTPRDVDLRRERRNHYLVDGVSPMQALQSAIVELSEELPYGTEYPL
ncbi:TraG/VirB4 family ATPase [Sinimarinibacterium sp. CAU 1509]|uniref:TraG/VirB4 family ATPase n=1 Tax=Sinimarinibacterium sp. CAU 1509 TaxID=2562283 RepID=UPI00146EB36C|nr:TraC family protein [Sinimarinibacterium sp. CAU 1509]